MQFTGLKISSRQATSVARAMKQTTDRDYSSVAGTANASATAR
jgi:hypothetical protein